MTIRAFCLLVMIGSLALSGCSFSRSSSSPFKWSSKSSESSSKSSSGGEEEKADEEESKYERDVKEATASAVEAGGGASQIMREVGDVANDHGVTDWENEPGTFEAIGRGLKGTSMDQFESLSKALAGQSELRKKLLMQGYTGGQ